MKPRNMLRKYGPKIGAVVIPTVFSASAFAQVVGEYETGSSIAWIGAGVAAGIVILGAMFGLVTMIGAGKKTQRAGT